MTHGNYSTVLDLLQLDYSNENKSRISHYLSLSDTWLDHYAPVDIISDISGETKNAACNYHTTFLYRLATERYSGDTSEFATIWKDQGKEVLEHEINSDAVPFKIYKQNK